MNCSASQNRGSASRSSASTLRIAELQLARDWGRLGVTLAPGKTQSDAITGAVARDLGADFDVIEQWNAAAVVTLLEAYEIKTLQIDNLGLEVVRRNMEWHHWPIADGCAPSTNFDADWPSRARAVLSLLEAGANVLIHCKGGLGRAGTIAARLLTETGISPKAAIERVRAVRPGSIETYAQFQWAMQDPMGHASDLLPAEAVEDRALGALVGLAVGDAVGTTLEFRRRPRFAVLDDLEGGGTFGLKRGEWTDDTAMSLALADSLLIAPHLDPVDLMTRFSDWHLRGTYSCTGTCFDIGNTVRAALERWRRSGEIFAGLGSARSAGNGALMRLAPVAVRHWNRRDRLTDVASRQTRTTHGTTEAIEASVYAALVLSDLIQGEGWCQVLEQRGLRLGPGIGRIREGSWRNRQRASIRADGYVVHSLEAAIWAVSRTTSFRSAVLLAANLGEDADTTAAITGQMAGARYGLSSIPIDWVAALAWGPRILDTARRLFSESLKTA